MFEVSLDSSWPKDSPSCEAPGFPELADPEIGKNRKNVFHKHFLRSKNIALSNKYFRNFAICIPGKDLCEGLGLHNGKHKYHE